MPRPLDELASFLSTHAPGRVPVLRHEERDGERVPVIHFVPEAEALAREDTVVSAPAPDGGEYDLETIYDLRYPGGKLRVCDSVDVEGLVELRHYDPSEKKIEAQIVLPTEVVKALIPVLQRKLKDIG